MTITKWEEWWGEFLEERNWSLCILYMEGRRVCIGRRWTSVAAAFCCLRLQHWRGGGCCHFLVFIEGGGFHLTAKQLLWIFLILEACQAVFVNNMVATQQRMWHKWGTGVTGEGNAFFWFSTCDLVTTGSKMSVDDTKSSDSLPTSEEYEVWCQTLNKEQVLFLGRWPRGAEPS